MADYTRECLALVVDTSLSGGGGVRELDALISRRGRPRTIVVDKSTELTSQAVLMWCQYVGVECHYITIPLAGQNDEVNRHRFFSHF